MHLCPTDIWRGEGCPGPGWDGWEYDHIPLELALGLPVEGAL